MKQKNTPLPSFAGLLLYYRLFQGIFLAILVFRCTCLVRLVQAERSANAIMFYTFELATKEAKGLKT